jgi:hypothetical protein
MFVPLAVILSSSALLVLGGAALAYPGGSPDPFGQYEAMMPGQSVDSPALSSCGFEEMRLVRDMTGYCQLRPGRGVLLVTIRVQFDRVQRVSFNYGSLRYGDLVKRWGRPTTLELISTRDDAVIFHARWGAGVFAIVTPNDPRINYLAPVRYLAIYRE